MSLNGKKVLVTGAGGFIGSHLAERLTQTGADVRALVHYNSAGRRGWLDTSELAGDMEIVAGDICDPLFVQKCAAGRDVILHLAALIAIPYSYHAPMSYVQTNIHGTMNVLNAARETGAHVVHTSTSEVYGTAQQVPINEQHPLQGQSPYSATKIAADKLAESYWCSFELPVVTVRPFNTFGPRQSTRAVIPTIITQCLAANPIKLGKLTPTRDLNFVSNTVDGFVAAATSEKALGQTVNLGTGYEISIGDLAEEIKSITGSDLPVECEEQRLRPTGSEVERLVADSSLAKELLDWTPAVDLRGGLEQTVEWFRANLEGYRSDVYSI